MTDREKLTVEVRFMTVADIKEYIDNAIDTAFAQKIAIDTAQILKKALIDTKGFLDELDIPQELIDEERENYITDGVLDELEPTNIQQAIKVIENEKYKLKFDVDKHQIDSCIFEIKNILRSNL